MIGGQVRFRVEHALIKSYNLVSKLISKAVVKSISLHDFITYISLIAPSSTSASLIRKLMGKTCDYVHSKCSLPRYLTTLL
jgi:hypothetical protein